MIYLVVTGSMVVGCISARPYKNQLEQTRCGYARSAQQSPKFQWYFRQSTYYKSHQILSATCVHNQWICNWSCSGSYILISVIKKKLVRYSVHNPIL